MLGLSLPLRRRLRALAADRSAQSMVPSHPRVLNPALQGGGAHGAFTWGVLDRLAEVEGLEIGGLSGTSAGAVNAVVFASGWLSGGPAGAQASLAELWRKIAKAGHRLTRSGLAYAGIDVAAHLLSPYQLNPFGLNPLRHVLNQLVDVERLRAAGSPRLFIAATNLRTGAPRIFENADLSLDAVLASACLPSLHHAVEIDGDAYWDGGYVSNPPILPLVEGSPARDSLLVRINVSARDEHPRSAAGIRNRIGEIVFEQPLERELALLRAHRDGRSGVAAWPFPSRRNRLARHRLHVVDGGAEIAALDPTTRIIPSGRTLEHLYGLGRAAASAWLEGETES
jgi:NTE family protein